MKTKIISLLLCVGMLFACNNTQKGAGIGAGIYKDSDEAFQTLKHLGTTQPVADSAPYMEAYRLWVERLGK